MKKSVAIVLALILLMSVFPGIAESNEPVTITFSYWRLGSNPQGPMMEEIVKKFEEKYPQIHVELDSTSQTEIANQLMIQSMGGETFDVVIMPFQQIGRFVEMGVVEPLDTYFAEDPEFAGRFYDFLIDMGRYGESIYALPQDIAMNVLLYNKQLFEKAGISEVPMSYDEFIDDCVKLTDKENGIAGFGLALANSTGNQARLMSYYWASGTYLINDDGDMQMTSEAGLKTMDRILEMINLGVTTDAPLELGYSGLLNMFTNANVAMMQGNIGSITSALAVDPDLQIGVAPLHWEEDGYSVESAMAFMTSNCEHKEAAWTFMKYLLSKETLAEWCIPLNYLPPSPAVAEMEEVKGNEYTQAYLSIIDGATMIPRLTENDAIFEIVYREIQQIVQGNVSARDGSVNAEKDVYALLGK